MNKNMKKENADISIIGYTLIWESGRKKRFTSDDEYYVFDKEEFKNTTGSDEAGDNSLYILKLILGKCGFII